MSFVQDIAVGMVTKRTDEEKKKASDLAEKARKDESKMVKGNFSNLEAPGGDLEFAVRLHRGEPIRKYRFVDGESYTIPLGVAKHINKQCKYKRSKYLVDKNNKPIIGADKPIQRYQFISQDYM